MKPPPFSYHAPTSVAETVALLDELGDEGKVLAGGQSLVPLLNMRLAVPAALVDLARLDGLSDVEVADGRVRVEAKVTSQRLLGDDEAAAAIPVLPEALGFVAHPVIRNRGTVVGSVVHGDPAAEMPAILGLLDGEVELVSRQGTRRVAASDFYLGPLESDTRADELAVAVTFRMPPPRSGLAFTELARRHGDYALAGVGVRVTLVADGRVEAAKAGFLGVGPVPIQVDLTGEVAGQPYDALDLDEAVATARAAIAPTDDIHASASYRRHLAGVLLGRSLTTATARAHLVAQEEAS